MRAASRRQHNDYNYGIQDNDPQQLWRINWKDYGFPYCGVYVITTDSLYPCKIGISVNPVKRLLSLQTSHWRPLQISGYRWCENAADAKKVEKEAHEILKEGGKSLMGEWFDIRVDKALEAIDWAGVTLSVVVNNFIPDEHDVRMALYEIRDRTYMAGAKLREY